MGRLDNLCMSYVSLRALLATSSDAAALKDETCVRAVALFDNEEVGSDSAQVSSCHICTFIHLGTLSVNRSGLLCFRHR